MCDLEFKDPDADLLNKAHRVLGIVESGLARQSVVMCALGLSQDDMPRLLQFFQALRANLLDNAKFIESSCSCPDCAPKPESQSVLN